MSDFPKLINARDNLEIAINNSSFSIGRSLSCNYVVEQLGVSRFHCVIKRNEANWTLFDRSTNGTYVNSKLYKSNQSVTLKHGDIIKLDSSDAGLVFTLQKEDTKIENPPKPELPNNAETLFPQDEVIYEEAASLLVETLEETCGTSAQTEEKNVEPENKQEKEKPKPQSSENFEEMEDELTCSICSELFIKAVTLNCAHTFCKFCIEEWKKNKSSCPICRKFITTVSPTLVLDNYIEKIINKQSEETKESRKATIKQREEVGVTAAGSSTSNNETNEAVIEIYSEPDDDDDEDESDYMSDYDYDDYYESGRSRGRYYGGYGACYICNQPGHWANGCPFRRR